MSETDFILVVDDSPTQLHQIRMVLEKDGFTVKTAVDGKQAMMVIDVVSPLLVVTDLQMPEMNGLELVAAIKGSKPSIPVILTTSQGSEEIAANALRAGASSYVPKRDVVNSLVAIVRQVLSVHQAAHSIREISKFVDKHDLTITLKNDESLVPSIIARLELPLIELDLFDESERMQIGIALDEALLNAIIHGNLDVTSEVRHAENGAQIIQQRKNESPYKERRVHINLRASREQATFVIRDEGRGFDASSLRDPTDPENWERAGGRGLLLINAFMDDVQHNDVGNEIIMTKNRQSGEEDSVS
jgi:DNA-binding response OmpR family regulator